MFIVLLPSWFILHVMLYFWSSFRCIQHFVLFHQKIETWKTLDHFKVHLHFILYNFSPGGLEKCALVTGFLQSYVFSGSLLLMNYFDATISVELLSKKTHNIEFFADRICDNWKKLPWLALSFFLCFQCTLNFASKIIIFFTKTWSFFLLQKWRSNISPFFVSQSAQALM